MLNIEGTYPFKPPVRTDHDYTIVDTRTQYKYRKVINIFIEISMPFKIIHNFENKSKIL